MADEGKRKLTSFAEIEARKAAARQRGEGGLQRVTYADLAALSKRPGDFAAPRPEAREAGAAAAPERAAEKISTVPRNTLEQAEVPRNPKELPRNSLEFQADSKELPSNEIPSNVPRNLPGRRPPETFEDAFRLPVNRAPSRAELSRIRNRRAAITTALPMDLYDALKIGVKELGGTVQSFVEDAIRERLAAFGYAAADEVPADEKSSKERTLERSKPTHLMMMNDEEYKIIINLFEELTGNSDKPADRPWKEQARQFPVMIAITGMLKAYSWSNGPIQLFKYCYACMEQVYADYVHRNNSDEWLRKLYREYWDRAEKRLGRHVRTLEEATRG